MKNLPHLSPWAIRLGAAAGIVGAVLAALAVSMGAQAALEPALAPPLAPSTVSERIAQLGNDKHSELVRQGYRIFTDTPRYAHRYSGNALSCANCHMDAGTKKFAAPMWAAWGEYPAYLTKNDRVVTFEERIQDCFRYSMNGFPPPLDSQEMRALTAYTQWLARGVAVGSNAEGRGFLTVSRTGYDPDPLKGRELFAGQCAACHGAHGEGKAGADGRQLFPPLWGYQSYNKAAGMGRVDLLAGFIKANMPLGNAHLSDQEALDIAAWINIQERWPDPRKGFLQGFFDK